MSIHKFSAARIRKIKIGPYIPSNLPDPTTPPPGKIWLICGGYIYHVTGTKTELNVYSDETGNHRLYVLSNTPAGDASINIPLFPTIVSTIADARQYCSFGLYFVLNGWNIWFESGDAAAFAEIVLLEFDQ